MKFNSLIPELTVTDLDKTKKFYVDILHFKIEYERPEDGFVFLSFENNQMMFELANDNWSVGILDHPFGRGVNFEMTVSDVDAMYKCITDSGITPFREIKFSRYRIGDEEIIQKEFLIQDPDGYLLRFTNCPAAEEVSNNNTEADQDDHSR